MSRRRVLPLLLVLAVLALAAAIRPEEQEEIVEVTRRDLVLTVEVEGTLRAVDDHLLGPPAVARVWNYQIAFLAPEGEDIRAGAPVLSFDASELEKRLLEVRAASETAAKEIEKKELDILVRRRADELRLAEAKAELEKKTLQLDRPSDVAAAIVTRELELDRERAEREVAYLGARRQALDEADATEVQSLIEQRDRARSRVRELEESIARMTLLAPREGTVVHVAGRSGQKKRVGDSVWRQEKVAAVPDLRRMRGEGFVDEFDAGKIAEGQRVELRLDAYPEIAFAGKVASFGKTIRAVSWSSPLRGLEVEIALDETDTTRMRPEMRFRGHVEIGRVEGALLVPLRALDRVDGRPAARRIARLRLLGLSGESLVPVILGGANDEMVEVVEGLAEGDRLRVPRANDEERR
jgi:multidrug efflux pump subunit AcrA (membrane-fusion protein)